MATDAFGEALTVGDDVLPLFKLRHIDEALRSVAVHGSRHNLTTGDEGELVKADRLERALAGGVFPLGTFGFFSTANPVSSVSVDTWNPGGGFPSSTYRIPIGVDCRLFRVVIRATTFSASPPTWNLNIFKGGVLQTSVPFTPGTNPVVVTATTELGSPIALVANNELHFTVSGTAVNAMIGTVVPYMEAA